MDLGARRDLWNMLKNYRNEKIIILTTHYMDEADVLGDRIGIMA
jgi:ATP-binding cassette subfamily A (ABC1) protein 3